MKRLNRWWVILLIVVGLLLAACAPAPASTTKKEEPVALEPLGDSGLNRVVLTQKAAARLDIQTAEVVEEVVTRQRVVWGEVIALTDTLNAEANSNANRVRVSISLAPSDLNQFDRSKGALVLVSDDSDEDEGLLAEPDDAPQAEASEDTDVDEDAAYYLVDNSDQKLQPGQRVRVVLDLADSTSSRLVVPYAAVIYDLTGETWVYVSPEPLVFVREPVVIDFVEGDRAVLREGPSAGTVVAVVGVAELYGADTGVGK